MQEQNEFQPSFADPTQPMEAEERTFYRNSTRDLVSRVAYLIGVPKRMFENEHEPPQLDIYDRLDKRKKRPDHPQSLPDPHGHPKKF